MIRNIRASSLVFLGEAPGIHKNHDPDKHALLPFPKNCAGDKLFRMTGLHMLEYLAIMRRNLVPTLKERRACGQPLLRHWARRRHEEGLFENRSVVIVGSVPARALGLDDAPLFRWMTSTHWGVQYGVIPHTSGRNRIWNDPEIREQGEAFLRWCGERAREGCTDFVSAWGRRTRAGEEGVMCDGGDT